MKTQETIHSYPGQPASDELVAPKHYKPSTSLPKYGNSALVAQYRQELRPVNPLVQLIVETAPVYSSSGHQ